MVELQPIEGSRNIAAAGYDPVTRTLGVQFQDGRRYDYRNVEPDDGRGLFTADSPGSFLNQRIKGVYDFERVETGP